LHPLAWLQAQGVERRERKDSGHGDGRRGVGAFCAGHVGHCGSKTCRKRRDGTWKSNPEGGPPAEKPEARTVRLAEIDVFASRARKHSPELAVAERPGQRHYATENPCAQEGARRAGVSSDIGRHQEDAGSDHASDDEKRGVGDSKAPRATTAAR
jgi:hypothetical protein